jgi:hypothetical protein
MVRPQHRLLRARREWPCRRVANDRDEVAPLQAEQCSIPLSARKRLRAQACATVSLP